MDYQGPIELEPGYFEFRLTWSGGDLLEMQGAQLDELHSVLAKAKALVDECDPRPGTVQVPLTDMAIFGGEAGP